MYLTDVFNSTDVEKQKHKEIRKCPIYHKVLSPPAGVAKLTVGALGPAAGVDVSNPGKIDPSGRRIESVGNWDSCKVPDSKGHCVSCSSFWLVS